MIFALWERGRRVKPYIQPSGEDMVGMLEPGVEIEGSMKVTTGMVRINTHFNGNVASQGTIVVAEQGEVEGEVHAKFVSITGKIKGAVHAVERVEIKGHGVVLGDLFTPSLLIDPGAYFEGQCHMPAPTGAAAPATPPKDKSPR
jgi:cytoskeletal protein CcmA (bactofilin family)